MSRSPLSTVVETTPEPTAAELLAAHADQLARVIGRVGTETAVETGGLPRSTVESLAAGDPETAGDLDLQTVAAVLALANEAPSAAAVVDAALDDLLFGMTVGVLDVEVVASEVAADLEPREVQGMLERRHPLTLREFAALQAVIAERVS